MIWVRLKEHGFDEGKTDGDERETEEERQDEHPLGLFQILLGSDEVSRAIVVGGHASEHNREDACERKAPAAQNGEYVDVFELIVVNLDVWLVHRNLRVDGAHATAHVALH